MSDLVTSSPVFETLSDADEYVPPRYDPPPTIGERVIRGWTVITATPGRAALTTVGASAAMVSVLALRPVTGHAADVHGPLVAHCGLGYFVFGHPNPVVRQVCGAAYSGRATVLLAVGVVLVTVAGALAWTCRRSSAPTSRAVRTAVKLTGTRGRAALLALAGSALVVWLASLRTVPIRGQDGLGPFAAHCGLSLYVFGDSSHVIQSSCRHAFASHAEILLISGCIFVIAMIGEVALIWSGAKVPEALPGADATREMAISNLDQAAP